ncbi:hypothetical protein V6N11_010729 [Hibiscus sabdariffa]|uniref:Reverse transcriptase zinc-binding domain-containing protein n=1 Tax=Hibiscus sabdariffa TaxID=183260 RepID=A0ABR2S645_9ROSI
MAKSYFSNLFTSDPRGGRKFPLHGRFPEGAHRLDLPSISVADVVSPAGEWRWNLIDGLLPAEILLRVTAIKCPLPIFSNDLVGWNATASSQFSVKSAYRIRNGIVEGPNEDIWKVIAQFKGTQRMQIFLWLACRDKIMTNYEQMKRHFVSDARCGLCGADVEDVDHILRHCPNSFLVWRQLVRADKMQDFMSCDIKSWIKINLT